MHPVSLLPQAHIMGGILFLSCDRVIISGNFRTGNSASNWTLSFSSNNMAPLIFGSIAFLHNYTDSTLIGSGILESLHHILTFGARQIMILKRNMFMLWKLSTMGSQMILFSELQRVLME